MDKVVLPKIVASFAARTTSGRTEAHVVQMQELLYRVLPPGILFPFKKGLSLSNRSYDRFREMLPFVTWDVPNEAPGVISVVLICDGQKTKKVRYFFTEILSRWLIPNRLLTVIATNSLDFHFEGAPKENYTIIEAVLQVDHIKDNVAILENLPILVDDITSGLIDDGFAQTILESKGISLDEKSSAIHRKLVSVTQRYRKEFERNLFEEASYLMLHLSSDFAAVHNVKHMCRIICAHHLFRHKLVRETNAYPGKRLIRLKLLKTDLQYTFGQKNVLGVLVCINQLNENEAFEEQHILKAFSSIINGVKTVPGSFFSYQRDEAVKNVYVEFEKLNGSEFILEEIRTLYHQLPDELKGSIEPLVNAVYMHHNEEEVYRNISVLSQELRYVNDTPQVIVSFQGHDRATLSFNVVLVRILKKELTPLSHIFESEPLHQVKFSAKLTKIVGYLRKKHPKEANVFQVEFDKKNFLRHDYTIDLYQARQFVIEMLEDLIGPVRDYNGGWLIKQLEVLSETKQLISKVKEMGKRDRLVENFFYALNPAVMRTLLSPLVIKKIFLLFYDLLEKKFTGQDQYTISTGSNEDSFFLMIRAENNTFKSSVEESIQEFFGEGNKLASVYLDVYGSSYLGFLIRHANQDQTTVLKEKVKNAMKQWAERQRRHQMLRISILRSTSLDPRIGTDRTSGIILTMLYEGLMRIGMNGEPTFGVAEDYSISQDGKTYTFKIRNCQWTNGFPLIALDFEYAWKKILEPSFNNIYVYLFYPIKNAKAIKMGKCSANQLGVKATDAKTLVVELEHPAPYFLGLIAHWAYSPLCRDIDRIHPGWSQYGSDRYVSNGPFKLAHWKDDRGLQVLKNPGYWDAKNVKLKGINISVIENAVTAMHMYQKNQLDWVGEPLSEFPAKTLPFLKNDKDVIEHPIAAICWYQYNVDKFPFNNPKMRKAFGYAINRAKIIEDLSLSGAKPALSIVPPMFSLQEEPLLKDYDTARAKELFEEALQEMGMSKDQLPPIILTHSSKDSDALLAKVIQQQWQDLFRIPIVLEGVDRHIYLKHSIKHNFQIRISLWYSWYDDPIYNLEYMKYRDDEMNASQWENQEFIKLLDQSDKELDPLKRKSYLQKAESLLLDQMPVVPMYFYSLRYKKKDYLENIFISNIGQIDFKWASVAKR